MPLSVATAAPASSVETGASTGTRLAVTVAVLWPASNADWRARCHSGDVDALAGFGGGGDVRLRARVVRDGGVDGRAVGAGGAVLQRGGDPRRRSPAPARRSLGEPRSGLPHGVVGEGLVGEGGGVDGRAEVGSRDGDSAGWGIDGDRGLGPGGSRSPGRRRRRSGRRSARPRPMHPLRSARGGGDESHGRRAGGMPNPEAGTFLRFVGSGGAQA